MSTMKVIITLRHGPVLLTHAFSLIYVIIRGRGIGDVEASYSSGVRPIGALFRAASFFRPGGWLCLPWSSRG